MSTTPTASRRAPHALADILPDLIAPFPTSQVEVKPGATTADKTRALALVYLKVQPIEQRLDDLAGPAHWSNQLTGWGDSGVIYALTILGVTRYASGESEASDPNCKTSAEAQAFKRAFTRFGCRYTYTRFPKSAWFDYDPARKAFANPHAVLIDLYRAAGLEDYIAEETVELARATARKYARADAPPMGGITPKQLALLRAHDQLGAAQAQFGVARLEDLTFAQAAGLITVLPPRRAPT